MSDSTAPPYLGQGWTVGLVRGVLRNPRLDVYVDAGGFLLPLSKRQVLRGLRRRRSSMPLQAKAMPGGPGRPGLVLGW